MKTQASRVVLLSLASLSLTGCWSVGPDFSALKGQVLGMVSFNKGGQLNNDSVFQNLSNTDQNDSSQGLTKWWEEIDDPTFDAYMKRLLQQNLDLRQATARIEQAGASLKTAQSSFLPSIGASSDAGREFGYNAATGKRRYTNNYNAGLSASWQADIFGKLRRSEEAAQANFTASIYDKDALAQSLVAALFDRHIATLATQEALSLSKQIVNNRQTYFDTINRRYEAGANGVNASDVYQARKDLETAKSDTHDYEIALSENLYAIDILLGRTPGTTPAPQSALTLNQPARAAPACIPVSLIDRRPDLRAEELRLKAANAEVGVAVADLYPNLSFSGNLGVSSDSTGSLLSSERLAGSLISMITARLYEGGALRARIRLREAEVEEAASAYAQSILTAIEDVENALKAENELGKKLGALNKTYTSQRTTAAITDERYSKGVASVTDVLDARYQTLLTQMSKVSTQQELWAARTALYLSLGGDWFGQDAPCNALTNIPDFIPAQTKTTKTKI